MTRGEMEELAGSEVMARLVNRGVSPAHARHLVEERPHNRLATDEILRVLNDRRQPSGL